MSKYNVQVSSGNSYITETKCKIDVFVELNEILNCQEDGIESINYDIFTKTSCGSNWNWIGIDCSESLLINWMLTLSWRNFFFSWISDEMILQDWVHNKNRLKVMNILSLLSLSENINFRTNRSLSNFWELCVHIIGECSELLDINTSTSPDIVTKIFNQSFPNDDHLGLWLQWLQISYSSLSWIVVLSWVFISILENPMKKRL